VDARPFGARVQQREYGERLRDLARPTKSRNLCVQSSAAAAAAVLADSACGSCVTRIPRVTRASHARVRVRD